MFTVVRPFPPVPSHAQDGTTSSDWGYGAAMAVDGSVVIRLYSSGNFAVSESSSSSSENLGNVAAVKLDSQGEEVWRWQVQTYQVQSYLS